MEEKTRIPRLDAVPEGYVKAHGVMTTPKGYTAYKNTQPFFRRDVTGKWREGGHKVVFVKDEPCHTEN